MLALEFGWFLLNYQIHNFKNQKKKKTKMHQTKGRKGKNPNNRGGVDINSPWPHDCYEKSNSGSYRSKGLERPGDSRGDRPDKIDRNIEKETQVLGGGSTGGYNRAQKPYRKEASHKSKQGAQEYIEKSVYQSGGASYSHNTPSYGSGYGQGDSSGHLHSGNNYGMVQNYGNRGEPSYAKDSGNYASESQGSMPSQPELNNKNSSISSFDENFSNQKQFGGEIPGNRHGTCDKDSPSREIHSESPLVKGHHKGYFNSNNPTAEPPGMIWNTNELSLLNKMNHDKSNQAIGTPGLHHYLQQSSHELGTIGNPPGIFKGSAPSQGGVKVAGPNENWGSATNTQYFSNNRNQNKPRGNRKYNNEQQQQPRGELLRSKTDSFNDASAVDSHEKLAEGNPEILGQGPMAPGQSLKSELLQSLNSHSQGENPSDYNALGYAGKPGGKGPSDSNHGKKYNEQHVAPGAPPVNQGNPKNSYRKGSYESTGTPSNFSFFKFRFGSIQCSSPEDQMLLIPKV